MSSEVFADTYRRYRSIINDRLAYFIKEAGPVALYEPIAYVMESGGKRVRPVLVMLCAEAVGGAAEQAVGVATAVEILHNFTLVHDDIMDQSPMRRGRPTVHMRWDQGTAILTGDVMFGMALKSLTAEPTDRMDQTVQAFVQGHIDVCEGQALDREFETRASVSTDDYLDMIARKTGRLIEMAAELGGIVGGGTGGQISALAMFARNVGIAFQIHDDLLDVTAVDAEFGKRLGSDVIEGKKSFLFVHADAAATSVHDRALLDEYKLNRGLPVERLEEMLDLYKRLGSLARARTLAADFSRTSELNLAMLPDSVHKEMLRWYADWLMNRTH